jgi:hypothetical protein
VASDASQVMARDCHTTLSNSEIDLETYPDPCGEPSSDNVDVACTSPAASVVPNADSERTLNEHDQECKQGLNRRP